MLIKCFFDSFSEKFSRSSKVSTLGSSISKAKELANLLHSSMSGFGTK